MVVSFIGGKPEYPEKTTDLSYVTDKLALVSKIKDWWARIKNNLSELVFISVVFTYYFTVKI